MNDWTGKPYIDLPFKIDSNFIDWKTITALILVIGVYLYTEYREKRKWPWQK